MNIILIDDHTLFRESLRRLLEGEPEWKVVGDYGSAKAAVDAIASGLVFDLALIDFELEEQNPAANGLAVARRVRYLRPGMPILMVTAGMKSNELLQAIQELKICIFLKNEPAEELFLAMRRTLRGEMWVSSAASLSLLQQQLPASAPIEISFSIRERDTLRLILEGQSNKEIGTQLEISESSVKAAIQKLFNKAGVRSRSQLVRFAIELKPDLNLD